MAVDIGPKPSGWLINQLGIPSFSQQTGQHILKGNVLKFYNIQVQPIYYRGLYDIPHSAHILHSGVPYIIIHQAIYHMIFIP